MNKKRKAVLAACSDPLSESRIQKIDNLIQCLQARGLTVVCSPYLFGCYEIDPGRKKAEFLNRCFADPEVEFIFDVSGADPGGADKVCGTRARRAGSGDRQRDAV